MQSMHKESRFKASGTTVVVDLHEYVIHVNSDQAFSYRRWKCR